MYHYIRLHSSSKTILKMQYSYFFCNFPAVLLRTVNGVGVSVDPNIHQKGKYKRECEEKAFKIMQDKEELLSEGILPVGLRIPDCQYDGRYNRVMVTDTA